MVGGTFHLHARQPYLFAPPASRALPRRAPFLVHKRLAGAEGLRGLWALGAIYAWLYAWWVATSRAPTHKRRCTGGRLGRHSEQCGEDCERGEDFLHRVL